MIIGIDIGTSNSSVCFINEKGDAVPVNISTGMSMYGSNFSMPSAVYVEDDGNVLVGQAALNSRLRKPQCFRAEFKRNLGESIPILLGSRSFLPEDLYTELFRHMLARVQGLGQGPVEKSYVTHPASYGQERKNKTLSAAKAAGLFDVTLVDEPTSAAMHYLHLGYLKDGQTLLVYDFGGGTFDAALIQYKDGLFKALTEPLGLEHCGGIDIDRAIFADILSQISADTLKPLLDDPLRRSRLESKIAELAVKAKHHLTASTIYQEYIDLGLDGIEYSLTCDKLNGMIASLVQKTIDCCRRILAEADFVVDKLDGILLVGGTSRIPQVMQMLGQFAGKVPILGSVNLELAVAQGAVCYIPGYDENGPFDQHLFAAQQGNAQAQFNVGKCYDIGKGVEKDLYKAFEWYMKAAQQGYDKAQFNVGCAYEDGEGVEKDLSKAFEWYMKAAQQGYDKA